MEIVQNIMEEAVMAQCITQDKRIASLGLLLQEEPSLKSLTSYKG